MKNLPPSEKAARDFLQTIMDTLIRCAAREQDHSRILVAERRLLTLFIAARIDGLELTSLELENLDRRLPPGCTAARNLSDARRELADDGDVPPRWDLGRSGQ